MARLFNDALASVAVRTSRGYDSQDDWTTYLVVSKDGKLLEATAYNGDSQIQIREPHSKKRAKLWLDQARVQIARDLARLHQDLQDCMLLESKVWELPDDLPESHEDEGGECSCGA